MKKTFYAIALAAALSNPVGASATVLTFDDLGSDLAFLTSTYHGFDFGTNNMATTAWFHTSLNDNFYQAHSGATYLATDFTLYAGAPLTPTQAITSATAFTFNGAWFSGGDTIGYALYNGTTLVYTTPVASAPLTLTPQFVASNYTGLVTGVVILGQQGYYGMDDFTYNEVATPAAVPEPGALPLAMAGLVAMAAMLRRRGARAFN